MFIDEAVIRVRGGRGGDGVIHFISNRHNPRGGPDGGNGGDGGDVILRASRSVSTLLAFRNRPRLCADDGENGARGTRQGAGGADRIVMVPVGTLVRNLGDGELVADLALPGDEIIVARGGEGGRGNRSFATSVRRAPHICERGLRGEERTLGLELKLIADVGIIGYPNVGKSSLISRISSKKAKVADYPFTTVVPNLGVVDVDGRHQFVAVDIPGLIEGAHRGKGLGDRFLRHVERSRLLIHMVDLAAVEERDPLSDYERINEELAAFNPTLAQRPQIVVGNKVDLLDEGVIVEERKRFSHVGVSLHPISVATGRGVQELILQTFSRLQETEAEVNSPSSSRRRVYRYQDEEGFWIEREGDAYRVCGRDVERLVRKLNLDGHDAWSYLNERLDRMGVFRELSGAGVTEGDHIRIGDVELEFRE